MNDDFEYPMRVFPKERTMLSDDDRDYADLLFVRTRSGDEALQQQAWQALASWADSRQRQDYLRTLARTDGVLDQLAAALPRAAAPASATPQVAPARSRRSNRLSLAVAASLTLLAAGLWWLNPELSHQHYSVQIGEQREVHLADGSRVILDTASAIEYRSRLHSREINLLQGEALFDVAHAVVRPFTVQSADTQVRVVGTLFSVRRMDSGSRIKVAKGRVAVRPMPGRPPTYLNAGEQLETAAGDIAGAISAVDVASVGNWSDGRLVFDGVPLKDALAELQRYRKAPIVVQDSRIGELKLTGSFSSREPDRILGLLPALFKVKVSFASDGTAHISQR